MLLQCARMVSITYELFDQDIKVLDLFKTRQKRDEFLDGRFPGFRKCLTAMGPYLDQPPEHVTAHKLQNCNMFWFNWFTEFLHWVNFFSPSRFSDKLKSILNLDPWDWETVGQT